MRGQVGVGLVQWGSSLEDPDANRTRSVELAQAAFDQGADVVVLPELSVSGYTTNEDHLKKAAESWDGATSSAWRDVAVSNGGYVCGGFCEIDGDTLFNSALIVGPEGVVLHYRKLHPFSGEKNVFTPGDRGLPVARTRVGLLGVCVCYDLRFPEVARALALKGAEMICVPTAWLAGFDEDRWDSDGYCPQARGALIQGNLNQAFIACASQVGRHGDYEFLGSSVLADPYGKDLAGPLSGTDEEVVVIGVDLDDSLLAQERSGLISPRRDRRTDVYGIAIDGRIL